MKPQLLALVLTFLIVNIAGCAITTPDSNHYLLRHSVTEKNKQVTPTIAIGFNRIIVPSYLDQSGIVMLSEDNQVHYANYHNWAEPLGDGIRNYLKEAVGQASGFEVFATANNDQVWQYSIDLNIAEFHGSTDGKAHLVVGWRIVDTSAKQPPEYFEFSSSQALVGSGYPALITAQTELLQQLARVIAEQLKLLT